MKKIKEALLQLPHIQKVWVSTEDESIWYYRAKNGFKEVSRSEILEEVQEEILEEKTKNKNKK